MNIPGVKRPPVYGPAVSLFLLSSCGRGTIVRYLRLVLSRVASVLCGRSFANHNCPMAHVAP